ncbi:MAG TPA: universal stress protein [Gammaproteobacteria bacterium]|nr:universal stress protein [Gammaproteobacteria bacterium]
MWKILLPVDGSESALNAVKHVVETARARDDVAVTLLYVHLEPVRFGAVAAAQEAPNIAEVEKKFAEPALAEASKLLIEAKVRYEREVHIAEDVAPMIAKRAEELDSDAIVMGTHGGGPLARALLGSTAMKVVHLAKAPVTLVK